MIIGDLSEKQSQWREQKSHFCGSKLRWEGRAWKQRLYQKFLRILTGKKGSEIEDNERGLQN